MDKVRGTDTASPGYGEYYWGLGSGSYELALRLGP